MIARERLLAHATKLFAEHGFNGVTIRDISLAAEANVAAVNYHFGDKMGLYRDVIERCLTTLEATNAQAISSSGTSDDPAAQLTAFIHVFVERLLTPRADDEIQQLMLHEMSDPTPMSDVIRRRVTRPRMSYLCKVIGAAMSLPPADRAVVHCAASVQAQCLMAKFTKLPASNAAELADHIARFSLAGIRELGQRGHDQ